MARLLIFLLACLLSAGTERADLASARTEPDLEKRSRKALSNAATALKTARESYRSAELSKVEAALEEVRESVELADLSLKQTGKQPSRSPRHFKHAEIKTRELLRKLEDFRAEMSIEDRAIADKVRAYVQQVHDQLLLGIMGEKK